MTLINYFDRTVLSVAMPVLIQQFALAPVVVGYLLSTFIWSYALCQLPPGVMLARWGTRDRGAMHRVLVRDHDAQPVRRPASRSCF